MSGLSDIAANVAGVSKGMCARIATSPAAVASLASALLGVGVRFAVNYSSDRDGGERVAQGNIDIEGKAIAVGRRVQGRRCRAAFTVLMLSAHRKRRQLSLESNIFVIRDTFHHGAL
jgi:hypothetical protein